MANVFVFITLFFCIGGIGTLVANRNKPPEVRRQRWLKFFTYLLLVAFLVVVLVHNTLWFRWVAFLVVGIGFWELWKVRREGLAAGLNPGAGFHLAAFALLALFGWGFWNMATHMNSRALVVTFLLVFMFDGFSQISGQVFGRHKLFPAISPGKTAEGLLGGLAITLLTAVLFYDPSLYCWPPLPTGLLIAAAALGGDWLTSFYKRKHGVKDYSSLIPGHGGVLDRFDSWIPAGALAWWAGLFY